MWELKTINIEITSFCPLACPICFFKNTKPGYIEEGYFEKIIKEAKAVGVQLVILSGGEPMEHIKIFRFIELVKKNDMQVIISSSGIKIDKDNAWKLKKTGLDCCYISLSGSTPKIHNQYRESFEFAINAMKELFIAKQEFRINWVACSDNIDDFPNVIQLAKEYGAKGIDILRQKPSKSGLIENPINKEKLRILSDMIGAYIDDEFIRIESCFEILKYKSMPYFKSGVTKGCMAGSSLVAVKPDGSFMPCAHLDSYLEKAESLQEYLEQSQTLRKFRAERGNSSGKCLKCVHKKSCNPCKVQEDCPTYIYRETMPQTLSIYEFTNKLKK